jgi:hypothetical protein
MEIPVQKPLKPGQISSGPGQGPMPSDSFGPPEPMPQEQPHFGGLKSGLTGSAEPMSQHPSKSMDSGKMPSNQMPQAQGHMYPDPVQGSSPNAHMSPQQQSTDLPDQPPCDRPGSTGPLGGSPMSKQPPTFTAASSLPSSQEGMQSESADSGSMPPSMGQRPPSPSQLPSGAPPTKPLTSQSHICQYDLHGKNAYYTNEIRQLCTMYVRGFKAYLLQ